MESNRIICEELDRLISNGRSLLEKSNGARTAKDSVISIGPVPLDRERVLRWRMETEQTLLSLSLSSASAFQVINDERLAWTERSIVEDALRALQDLRDNVSDELE